MALSDIYPGVRQGTLFTPMWRRFIDDLRTSGINVDPTQSGGYNPRNIAGTGIPSLHASDRAYDVNWRANPVGSMSPPAGPSMAPFDPLNIAADASGDRPGQEQIPAPLARALAQAHGLRWGGDFQSRSPDPMHFEVAPGGGPIAPPIQSRGLTQFAGMQPPMRGPATAGVGLLASGAQPAQEPSFPSGAPLPGGMTIPPLEAPQAQEQPLGNNLLGLGRGILNWFSQPTPPGASGPPTPPPTLAAPPAAPMGPPPVQFPNPSGIGSDAVAAPVAPSAAVPPFSDPTVSLDPSITMQLAQAAHDRNNPPATPGPEQPGYFERLMSNPAFLAGLSILGTAPGGNWGPAGAQAITQAQRSRREQEEHQRLQRQRTTMDRVWAEAFPGGNPNMQHPLLAGQTPQVAALLYSMGAESALPLLARSAMDRRQFGFTEAGGQLYVTDPRSGQAVPVPGSRPAAASGFRWTEDGTRQEPIPGGPGEQIPADLAGRVALSQTAQPRLAGARDFYLNRMTVGESARHAIGGAMLAPGYRQAQLVADLAIETAIRAASGANAPEAEVQRYINQFTPRVTDPMEVRRMKLDMLDDFLRNYQAAATRGRGGVQAPQQGGDFSIRRLP